MKTPKSIQYNTGEQLRGYRQIDNFFEEIIEKYKIPTPPHPYITKRVEYLFPDGDSHLLGGMFSADKVHFLMFMQSAIASVIETRTDSNRVQFNFFYNKETIESKLELMNQFEKNTKKILENP